MFFGMSLRYPAHLFLNHTGVLLLVHPLCQLHKLLESQTLANSENVIPAHTLLLGELLPWSLGGNLWPWKDLKTQNWETRCI